MKKITPVCALFFLLVSLFSCKGLSQKDRQNSRIYQIELPDGFSSAGDIDTIIASNAPSRITRKIRKDNDGNLLFAAYEDIIRYDGISFTNLSKEEGLNSFDAFDAFEDKKGTTWIASTHFGVFRHGTSATLHSNGKTISRFTTKEGLAHNRTMCVYEDRAGGIWIGTQGGISYCDEKALSPGQERFRNFTVNDGLTNNDINIIMEDKTGKVWVGTRGTLCMYNPAVAGKPDEIVFTEVTDQDGKPFENIWSIVEDQKGNIWLAGQYGLWRISDELATNYTTVSVMGAYEDKKGNVWFTHQAKDTHQAGLSYFDQKSLLSNEPKPTQIFIGDGMFFGIAEDKAAAIWVGTLKGAFRYDGKSVVYYRTEQAED